jgi:hypothetical protein
MYIVILDCVYKKNTYRLHYSTHSVHYNKILLRYKVVGLDWFSAFPYNVTVIFINQFTGVGGGESDSLQRVVHAPYSPAVGEKIISHRKYFVAKYQMQNLQVKVF